MAIVMFRRIMHQTPVLASGWIRWVVIPFLNTAYFIDHNTRTHNAHLLSVSYQQRMEHKNRFDGKSSSLNDGRLARLQSIGFRWAKRKGQASWEEKFVSLSIVHVKDVLYKFPMMTNVCCSWSTTSSTERAQGIQGRIWQLPRAYQVQREHCTWKMGFDTTFWIQEILWRRCQDCHDCRKGP